MTRNHFMLTRCNAEGFLVYTGADKEPLPDDGIALINEHTERLRALLDKPVILSVTWEDGDPEALVRIIPAENRECSEEEAKKPFEKFTLPFPKEVE